MEEDNFWGTWFTEKNPKEVWNRYLKNWGTLRKMRLKYLRTLQKMRVKYWGTLCKNIEVSTSAKIPQRAQQQQLYRCHITPLRSNPTRKKWALFDPFQQLGETVVRQTKTRTELLSKRRWVDLRIWHIHNIPIRVPRFQLQVICSSVIESDC